MNRIRNIYGKGSNNQDVNSGNIHDNVIDPQPSSDSSSAGEHSGLPVSQMMSLSTFWNFGMCCHHSHQRSWGKSAKGDLCEAGDKADFLMRKRWVFMMSWCLYLQRKEVESSAWEIMWMPLNMWKNSSVLSHRRLLSGYSWNRKPCSSRETCWGSYKTSQFVILSVDKPFKLRSSWDSGGLGLKWSHSTICPKQVSMFYYQLLALI